MSERSRSRSGSRALWSFAQSTPRFMLIEGSLPRLTFLLHPWLLQACTLRCAFFYYFLFFLVRRLLVVADHELSRRRLTSNGNTWPRRRQGFQHWRPSWRSRSGSWCQNLSTLGEERKIAGALHRGICSTVHDSVCQTDCAEQRIFGRVSLVAFSTTLLRSWESVARSECLKSTTKLHFQSLIQVLFSLLQDGSINGGSASLIYGLIFAFIGSLATCASLAEMSSMLERISFAYYDIQDSWEI